MECEGVVGRSQATRVANQAGVCIPGSIQSPTCGISTTSPTDFYMQLVGGLTSAINGLHACVRA